MIVISEGNFPSENCVSEYIYFFNHHNFLSDETHKFLFSPHGEFPY